ncbi:MAG: 5'-methylthioadenosine/adenosylhomocysteine nucleosidase [Dongiaceae bacterium]
MATRPIGIICALPEERVLLTEWLADSVSGTIAGRPMSQGKLDGRPVIVTESGCGKVAATIQATILMDRYDCRALMVSGVAGGLAPELAIADIVVADRLVQHDYGHLTDEGLRPFRPGEPPLGDRRHEIVFTVEPALLELVKVALRDVSFDLPPALAAQSQRRDGHVRLAFGPILTGDQFINSETTRERLHRDFQALAVEMEGGAVAQVAAMAGIPAIVVRSLSDLAGRDSHLDFGQFVAAVAPMAATVVRRITAVI